MSAKMRMKNLEGETEVTRVYRGVKVIRDGVTITNISGRVWVSHPGGKIITAPHLMGAPSFTKAVELKVIATTEQAAGQECEFKIEVTGGLTNGDPGLDYEYQAVYSKGVCVTREEMADAYRGDEFDKEYHSFDVVEVINKLELEVTFPEGYKVHAYPMVFFANGETIVQKELQQIIPGFSKTATPSVLRVDQPKVGFRYAIYWIPPSAREVEQLRK